jgi:predicted ArsR family transcriptional regulator
MTKTAKSVGAPKAETVRPPKRMAAPAKATKKARLIALLSRKSGADVPGLSTTLGWLPHTTRAALTGLRKAGYEITKVKPGNGKPSRYQIIGSPEENVV